VYTCSSDGKLKTRNGRIIFLSNRFFRNVKVTCRNLYQYDLTAGNENFFFPKNREDTKAKRQKEASYEFGRMVPHPKVEVMA
jgi:predicted secreted acid phosphatase